MWYEHQTTSHLHVLIPGYSLAKLLKSIELSNILMSQEQHLYQKVEASSVEAEYYFLKPAVTEPFSRVRASDLQTVLHIS